MAIAWFLCPYIHTDGHRAGSLRYCAMDDFTSQIHAAGGWWAETEILGDRAIVKVRASLAVLTTIAGTLGFRRLPKDRLDDSLADLPQNIKTKLRDEVLDAGYTVAQFNARFPDGLSSVTLRDLLRFLATRRLKPRYDATTESVILDGPVQVVRPVDGLMPGGLSVDNEVQE